MSKLILAAAAALALSLGAASTASAQSAAQAATFAENVSAAPIEPVTVTDEGRVLGDIILGDPNAPVTIIEYASLTCPHCANFHEATFPAVKEEFIDTGLAKMIVREVYFDQFGLLAAAVARCGGEERYHRFLDVFYERQRDWARGDTQSIVTEIRRIGLLGGLSPEKVDACLTDQAYHTALVEAYQTAAVADDVRSTPYFLIDGEPVRGAVGADTMADAINAKLPN